MTLQFQAASLRAGSPSRMVAFAVTAVILLGGCSGISAPTPLIAESMPTATPTPSPAPISLLTPTPERCAGGRLRVGDLAAVGDEWVAGVQSAIETARAWRPDARLVTMQVGCAPLEAGFRWQGTFYSETAQSFFFSDTGMSGDRSSVGAGVADRGGQFPGASSGAGAGRVRRGCRAQSRHRGYRSPQRADGSIWPPWNATRIGLSRGRRWPGHRPGSIRQQSGMDHSLLPGPGLKHGTPRRPRWRLSSPLAWKSCA